MKRIQLIILFLIAAIPLFSQNPEWINYNTSNSSLPDNRVLTIKFDTFNNKWIGTQYGGLVLFDGFDWIVYNTSNSGLPDNLVYSHSHRRKR